MTSNLRDQRNSPLIDRLFTLYNEHDSEDRNKGIQECIAIVKEFMVGVPVQPEAERHESEPSGLDDRNPAQLGDAINIASPTANSSDAPEYNPEMVRTILEAEAMPPAFSGTGEEFAKWLTDIKEGNVPKQQTGDAGATTTKTLEGSEHG